MSKWSTDANYPAGSDPWSGTPTKVEPSSGRKASGFVPKTRLPAPELNYLLSIALNALGYFGDGSDGDATISGTTTVAAQINSNLLTIASGGVYQPQGYIIRCTDTFTLQSGGILRLNAGAGGNGNGSVGGTPAGSIFGDHIGWVQGGSGSIGGVTGGNAGGLLSAITELFAGAGLCPSINGGGTTGLGGFVAGTSLPGVGSGLAQTLNYKTPMLPIAASVVAPGYVTRSGDTTPINRPIGLTQIVGGTGGGGGGGAASNGGGAGGGGGPLIIIVAPKIVLAGTVELKGGAGGAGHTAGNSGGGAGGSGGTLACVYTESYDATGLTLTATKGAAGASHGTGTAPTANVDGPATPFVYKLA